MDKRGEEEEGLKMKGGIKTKTEIDGNKAKQKNNTMVWNTDIEKFRNTN